MYAYTTIDSPVGTLKLIAKDERLVAVRWEHERGAHAPDSEMVASPEHPVLVETARQLGEYFAGRRTDFDLALDFAGTAFQKRVWEALLTIPFGETRSYLQIAEQIGNKKAVRAVGAANGKNPIPIIAPCHRVIGASGDLTGFGGGLRNKHLLLSLEARQDSLFPLT
jgi:methylated-DNA-[protein]-cysteine S-methyltransferase